MTIRKRFNVKRTKDAEPRKPKPLKTRKRARKVPVRTKKPPHEFKVPLNVYQKALDEIKTRKPVEFMAKKHYDSHVTVSSQNQCFNKDEKSVRVCGKFGLLQISNFQRAAKQALEMRDFKALYKIVIKGFELNNKDLNKVLYDVSKALFSKIYINLIPCSTSTQQLNMIQRLKMRIESQFYWKQLNARQCFLTREMIRKL